MLGNENNISTALNNKDELYLKHCIYNKLITKRELLKLAIQTRQLDTILYVTDVFNITIDTIDYARAMLYSNIEIMDYFHLFVEINDFDFNYYIQHALEENKFENIVHLMSKNELVNNINYNVLIILEEIKVEFDIFKNIFILFDCRYIDMTNIFICSIKYDIQLSSLIFEKFIEEGCILDFSKNTNFLAHKIIDLIINYKNIDSMKFLNLVFNLIFTDLIVCEIERILYSSKKYTGISYDNMTKKLIL